MPYGTKLTNTIGGPNYLTGDFNGDGVVNTADYTVWRDTKGQLGTEFAHPAADPNHDFVVDDDDYALWATGFGSPNAEAPAAALSNAVPEPTCLAIGALGVACTGVVNRRRPGVDR